MAEKWTYETGETLTRSRIYVNIESIQTILLELRALGSSTPIRTRHSQNQIGGFPDLGNPPCVLRVANRSVLARTTRMHREQKSKVQHS